MDTFSLLDQRHRNYFYKLASQDGRKSGRQIYQETVPPELQDCPHESAAYLDGLPQAGVEARHSSHIQSRANGGSDTQDNRIMERSSDNLARGDEDMTESEYQLAVDNNATDAEVIDNYFTYDETSTLTTVESTEIVTTSTETAPELVDVLSDTVLPFVYGTKAALYVHNRLTSNMTTDDRNLTTILIGTVTTMSLMTWASAAIPVCVGASLVKLGYRGFKSIYDANTTITPLSR